MSLRRIWTHHRTLIISLAGCLIAYVAWILYTGFIDDDAFITFRFASNLAAGHGFIYNPGERILGTSTPFFTLLMALWHLIWPDPVPGAVLLDLLAVLGTIILTYIALQETKLSTAQCTFAMLMLAISPRLLYLNMAGMETPWCLLFIAASWLTYRRKRWALTGVLLGGLLWVRLDMLLWVIILAIGAILQDRRSWRAAIPLAVGVYLPWLAFSWLYFGSPIPLAVTAKYWAYFVHGSAVPSAFIEPPLATLLTRLEPLGVVLVRINPMAVRDPSQPWNTILNVLLIVLLVIAIRFSLQKRILREITIFGVLETARLLFFQQTFFDRYFAPVLWSACILIGIALGSLWETSGSVRVTRKLQGLIPIVVLLLSAPVALANAAELRDLHRYRNQGALKPIGLWLRANLPINARVQLEPLGYVGYYSERIMLDEVGLVTPEVVELKKQGITQPLPMISTLSPDAFVIHCDDAAGIEGAAAWQAENLGHEYRFAVRFDPLGFSTGSDLLKANKPLARASCYEVWLIHR